MEIFTHKNKSAILTRFNALFFLVIFSVVVSAQKESPASATAIYGSRGSNGVIIITTKKGKLGRVQVNFDTEAGRTQNIALPLAGQPLNAQQYATLLDLYYQAGNGEMLNRWHRTVRIIQAVTAKIIAAWAIRISRGKNKKISTTGGPRPARLLMYQNSLQVAECKATPRPTLFFPSPLMI